MLPLHLHDQLESSSSVKFKLKEKLGGLFRLIFSDKNSRNLFSFLVLNLSFAVVELLYGVWTNSLGLISDSFHMFFDCTALLAGLAATVIARWKSNEAFSYGYVRAEIIAGFINGLFLLFIAFFIFSEAVERIFEPPHVEHERLFIVSILGFIVNLVGIFVFQHGGAHHGHSHGGDEDDHHHHDDHSVSDLKPSLVYEAPNHYNHCDTSQHSSHSHDHGHSHDHSSHGHSHDTSGDHGHSHGSSSPDHGHSHAARSSHGHSHGTKSHGHSHGGSGTGASNKQILKGVFLHILADTLGSVGVIISALLIRLFDWHIADPICSMIIAVLISVSTIPLLNDSASVLMQRTPKEIEKSLPVCYQRVMQLEGVLGLHQTHFWTLCSEVYVGTMKLEVSPDADVRYINSQTHNIFTQIGVRQLFVQIDYAQM